jgi:hypothetical protein
MDKTTTTEVDSYGPITPPKPEPQLKKKGRKAKYETEEERMLANRAKEKNWREKNKEFLIINHYYKANLPRTYNKYVCYMKAIAKWNEENLDRQFDIERFIPKGKFSDEDEVSIPLNDEK